MSSSDIAFEYDSYDRKDVDPALNDSPGDSSRPSEREKELSRNYGKYSYIRAAVLFCGDLIAFFAASLVVAAGLALITGEPALQGASGRMQDLGVAWHGWETLLVLAVVLSHLGGRGHYTQRIPFWTELSDVLRSSCIALLFDFVLATKIYDINFSTEAILRWILFVPLVFVIRGLVRFALNRAGMWSLRTIIVGDAKTAAMARAALSSDKALGYDVVAEIGFDRIASFAGARPWQKLMKANRADFVVAALGGDDSREARNVLASLALARVPFAIIPTVGGLPVFGFDAQYFFSHDVMLLVSRDNLTRPFNRAIKLAFDYVVASAILVALSPLFALIALAVKRDGGPVFFHHERIGAFGQSFNCFKFRSMAVDAHEVLHRLLERDPAAAAEWAATQKLRDDPRVTAVGRFLRATSLDELPQLLNILRGDMSLVGPRPIVASELGRYGDNICFYTEAKPGLTGLWQVSGRSDTSYERRVELDVWYVKNWTLWHDIAILFKTFPAVMRRQGAV